MIQFARVANLAKFRGPILSKTREISEDFELAKILLIIDRQVSPLPENELQIRQLNFAHRSGDATSRAAGPMGQKTTGCCRLKKKSRSTFSNSIDFYPFLTGKLCHFVCAHLFLCKILEGSVLFQEIRDN